MEIKSIKEQYKIKDICLKERLETIIPDVMGKSQCDAWIIASKEYNEDLVFDLLTPASYLNARRITMIVFIKDNESIKRFSLSLPDEDLNKYYLQYWNFGKEEQIEALNRLFDEYNPQKIAINISKNHTYADGLSYGLYQMLKEELKPEYVERFIVDEMLPIKTMEIRTATELTLYEELMKHAFSVIEETFSLDTITLGVTTTEDLEYFMMDRVTQRGLEYWFSPTIDKMREGSTIDRETGIIQKGDLLHCDFGIKYLNLCSDTQRLAYIAKDEEEDIPNWMKEGFKINDRFQDIVCSCMEENKSGNDVLIDSLEMAKKENIEACLYTHPCNIYGHGPGPTIGLWNNQNRIPIKGDITMSYDTVFALELNTKYNHNGINYTFFSEETISFTKEGVKFLYPGRENIYFLK
ncbi:M24 family metallopeptidase [Intestinibacter sp.]